MKIEQADPRTLKPYAGNPRHIDAAVGPVADSIRRFGFRKPIVVDAERVIIVGHVRHAAALQLGLATVPVHIAADMTPAQAKAYRLADNSTADLAEWDNERLTEELLALDAAGALEATAYSKADLDTLLAARTPPTPDEWAGAFEALPDGQAGQIRQTFTLTPDQKADVEAAVQAAQGAADLSNPDNPDPVGNALAHIVERYLEHHRQR